MSLLNQGINQGFSTRLSYDKCAYDDYLQESVASLNYKLNADQQMNCNSCLSVFGPRPTSGPSSYGVGTVTGNPLATSQSLVDIESILSNRNVIASKCKDGQVNDINVTKFKLVQPKICNNFLDPVATHLTNPPVNYRSVALNRFYDLPKNPQANIYWDRAANTKLEAIDNYNERYPKVIKYDPTLPTPLNDKGKKCKYDCYRNSGNVCNSM